MSEREASRLTNISRSSVKRIVKHDLHLKTYKRIFVPELSDIVRSKRHACAGDLLRKFRDQQAIEKICFTDEKIFTVSAPFNAQNDRVRSTAQVKRDVPKVNT